MRTLRPLEGAETFVQPLLHRLLLSAWCAHTLYPCALHARTLFVERMLSGAVVHTAPGAGNGSCLKCLHITRPTLCDF